MTLIEVGKFLHCGGTILWVWVLNCIRERRLSTGKHACMNSFLIALD